MSSPLIGNIVPPSRRAGSSLSVLVNRSVSQLSLDLLISKSRKVGLSLGYPFFLLCLSSFMFQNHIRDISVPDFTNTENPCPSLSYLLTFPTFLYPFIL